VRGGSQDPGEGVLLGDPVFHQPGGRDDHAFFSQVFGGGGHGTGGDTADFGVVGAVGGVGEELAGETEHGADHGDIRQVRAAEGRVVGNKQITWRRRDQGGGAADAFPEGSKVDGDVRSVDKEMAGGIKQGAGVIEAFLDVGADAGAAEEFAHTVDHALEAAAEELGGGGVGDGGSTGGGSQGLAVQQPTAFTAAHGGPAGFEDQRAEMVLDDLWLLRSRVSGLGGEGFGWQTFLRERGDHAERNDLNGAVQGRRVTVELLERGLERGGQFGRGLERNGQGGVLALEAEVGEAAADVGLRGVEGGEGFSFKAGQDRGEPCGIGERLEELLLAEVLGLAGGSSGGTEETGLGGHEDLPDAKFLRDGAGVLRARPAESEQSVSGGIAAIPHGDGADGFGHAADGDLEEAGEKEMIVIGNG
jgi:hypothetical protein